MVLESVYLILQVLKSVQPGIRDSADKDHKQIDPISGGEIIYSF